jgi:hypothetical protein
MKGRSIIEGKTLAPPVSRSGRALGSRAPSIAWFVLAAGMVLCVLAAILA